MSNSLDPDQAGCFVRPDLGPNCLQRLSADDKSHHWAGKEFLDAMPTFNFQPSDFDLIQVVDTNSLT